MHYPICESDEGFASIYRVTGTRYEEDSPELVGNAGFEITTREDGAVRI